MAAVARALLQLLIGLLEGLDAVVLALLALWWRVRATATPWARRRGRGAVAPSPPGPAAAARATRGHRPPPPRVVGLILAEPRIADVSLRTVARVAMWCMAYDSIEQLHVYDSSGHLKASQPLLEADLQELASQEGLSVLLQSGWSQLAAPGSSGSDAAGGAAGGSQQLSKQPPRLWFGTGFANSSSAGSSNDRTWSMWLSETMQAGYYTAYSTQRPPVPPSASSHLQAQHKQRQQQQQQAQQAQQQQQAHNAACDIITAPNGSSNSRSAAAAAVVANGEHHAQQQWTAADCSVQEEQCPGAAAPGAGATHSARCERPHQQPHVQQTQSSTKQQRSRSSSGGKAARVIRLLSAEDAFQPVLAAVLERWPAAAAGVSSPHVTNSTAAAAKAPRQLFGSSSGGEKLLPASEPAAGPGKGRHQPGATTTSSSSSGSAAVADHGSCSSRVDGSSRTVLQALYSSTTAAAAVVAGAMAPATSSTCKGGGKQQQAQQAATSQAGDTSMLQELAGVAGRELLQEPQLLLVFGPVLTLAGYPPFHTRVAEVQHVGPLASCRRRDVEAAVATYCQVLQRHGA